jgi:hypothetical protein
MKFRFVAANSSTKVLGSLAINPAVAFQAAQVGFASVFPPKPVTKMDESATDLVPQFQKNVSAATIGQRTIQRPKV